MNTNGEVTIRKTDKKWFSSPVTFHKGSLEDIGQYLPTFERRIFGHTLSPVSLVTESDLFNKPMPIPPGTNPFYDTIVRKPMTALETEIPVGIVSKQYTLVQHHQVFNELRKAILRIGEHPSEVMAELELSLLGERMRLGVQFPRKFGFEVRRGDIMEFKLDCYNSVDGSLKLSIVYGWVRLVCTNGMVSFERNNAYRGKHTQYMDLNDIIGALQEGIACGSKEQAIYQEWLRRKVTEKNLSKWVNDYLAERWGVKAAVRTWHITRCGHDVTLEDPFEAGLPTKKTVRLGDKVPGAVTPGNTVYAVSQALSWLAKERRDVQEQLEWKQQIPQLLAPLCSPRGGGS